MDDETIGWLGASELVAAYAAGSLTPVEVTEAILRRIEAVDPSINAFCLVDAQGALAQAAASTERWRRREPMGPLDGVPATVKDLIDARGWPTLKGSLTIDPAGPWENDAPVVARLREAGAVLLGKTTTPEFGWRGSTDSALTGITRNPWRLDRTPGGSSGGAVAALAAGLGPLALGTDGGGSIRIPAAFTGTVGIKAQFGRVPAHPHSPMGTVAHIGPHARNVRDCALMLGVLAGFDDRDWLALPGPIPDWVAGVDRVLAHGGASRPLAGMRIGFSPRLRHARYVDPRIEAAVAAAAGRLGDLGAIVEQADPDIPDGEHAFRVHWFSSARQLLHRLPPEKYALLDPGLRGVVEQAAQYTLADFLDAQTTRAAIAFGMVRFARRFDLLLTPATAVLPFEVGLYAPPRPAEIGAGPEHDWAWWTPFSWPFNLTQQPAIVLPCGFSDDGLPIAMQLVAPKHREDQCFRVAAAYEAATDWSIRRPPLTPR
ncbi:MAG: amidase [Pseudomonadota bacterium]|nr:amidase [Pseudomonadota bacterium]